VEEKEFILDNRSTNGAAKGVANQLRTSNSGTIIKKVIGSRTGVAISLKERSVPIITAALGNEGDLSAGGSALSCIGINGGYAKLFDCLGVQPNHWVTLRRRQLSITATWDRIDSGDRVCLRIIDIHPVKCDIRLVRARACDITLLRYCRL